MNQPHRVHSVTTTAVIALDCPWCAEPVRVTEDELADGFACQACSVQLDVAPDPPGARAGYVAAVAA